LAIPASGVFQSGTRQIAFVDHGGGYFEPRDIEVGARAGDDFVVLKGLKAGERIATSANFLIDSESQLQAAMGSFAPPPPGVGAAAAMNALQGATLEYSCHCKSVAGDCTKATICCGMISTTLAMPSVPSVTPIDWVRVAPRDDVQSLVGRRLQPDLGAVAFCVGIDFDAISSMTRLPDHAARSMV
jgi:hypothetical protein